MKVAFVHGPNDLRLGEVEKPRPGARDVVLRVGAAAICGSDLIYVAKGGVMGPTETPIPLGHELSGTVAEIGAEVRSLKVGDRVVLNPLINMIGNGGSEGGFGDWLLVRDVVGKPESLLHLPDHLSLDAGALVEPLAVATHAINQLGAKAGDKVAIFGAGPIGLASVIVLRHRKIDDIVVFDLSPFRRERAVRLGAKAAIDPREQTPRDALVEHHGAVRVFRDDLPQTTHFLEASGAPVIADIVGFARAKATICVVSTQKAPTSIDFVKVMTKELTLTAALGYPSEFADVLEMLQSSTIDLEPMISHKFAGAEMLEAFHTAQQPDKAAKVLVQFGV